MVRAGGGLPLRLGDAREGGAYVVLIRLERAVELRVGSLGLFHCAPGWYAYAGSALRGLRRRALRHLARAGRVRWHVDYLKRAAGAHPIGAILVPGRAIGECALNRIAGGLLGGRAPIPGFGASDCRSGCPAHLWTSPSPVALSHLAGLHPAARILRARGEGATRPPGPTASRPGATPG